MFENHETREAYDIALVQKMLVLNFITSYLPVFLTAFVYVPFANVIVPYLDVFRVTVRPFVSPEDEKIIDHADFRINPARLKKQVIYFTVTAQIVNFAMEAIVPFILRHVLRKYKAYTEENSKNDKSAVAYNDAEDEVEFLTRVRNEADLPEYDVTADLREMVIQFGYLSLFSPIWPLVPVSFLINNWIELRSDFFKICKECKRPVPERADTIGPWLDMLGLLAWLGSITSSALIYMFRNNEQVSDQDEPTVQLSGWALLLTVFFAEHIYLAVRYAVETTMAKIETPSMRKERAEKYLLRKNYYLSVQSNDFAEDRDSGQEEEITRASLEQDARDRSLSRTSDSDRFWGRQKSWREASQIGASIISSYQQESKKER